jgi:hypothetical protein
MKPQEAHATIQMIAKWMEIRAENGLQKIDSTRDFMIQADHSLRGGLLGRMMIEGKDPLPHPPPLSFSRPWYSLIEKGKIILDGDFVYAGIESKKLAICQHQWDIVHRVDESYIVQWEPDKKGHSPWGRWKVEPVPEGWSVSKMG